MNEAPLSHTDILVGHTYQAKTPAGCLDGYTNDRMVCWISPDKSEVQYDSPSVANGRRLPKVKMDAFLRFARVDVTALMPKGSWRRFCWATRKPEGSTDA